MKRKIVKILKWIGIIAAILLVVYLVLFKTTLFLADIRPKALIENYSLKNDGVSFVEKAQLAHDMPVWQSYDSIVYSSEVEFVDFKASFLIAPVDASKLTSSMLASLRTQIGSITSR